MEAILERTRTGRAFRLRVNGQTLYVGFQELMVFAYGENHRVVFKTWEALQQQLERTRNADLESGTDDSNSP